MSKLAEIDKVNKARGLEIERQVYWPADTSHLQASAEDWMPLDILKSPYLVVHCSYRKPHHTQPKCMTHSQQCRSKFIKTMSGSHTAQAVQPS